MSPSSRIEELAGEVEELLDEGNLDLVEVRAVQRLMSTSVRLYAAKCAEVGRELEPTSRETTTTDAVTAACGLVREQGLNVFELAVWFGRSEPVKEER